MWIVFFIFFSANVNWSTVAHQSMLYSFTHSVHMFAAGQTLGVPTFVCLGQYQGNCWDYSCRHDPITTENIFSRAVTRLNQWKRYPDHWPWVHVGRGLIDDEDAVFPEDSPGQAHQLPLAHAEVWAWFSEHCLQLIGQVLHHGLQLHLQRGREELLPFITPA